MASDTVTLRDIAREADVSVATVSYVLNGKGRVASQKRQAIQTLLRQAGYRPKYKRYPVFYLSDHREYRDPHAFAPFLQKYDGLNASLHEEDVSLRVEFLYRPNSRDLITQLNELTTYKPGAVVMDSNLREDMEQVGQFFESRDIRVVQIGHVVRCPRFDAVVVDNFGGAYQAVRYFIEQGHKRIGTIRWFVSGDPASSKKHSGYLCAMREAGIEVRPEYIVESPFGKRPGRCPGRVAMEQLAALPEPPTAVFVENSFISASLLYPVGPTESELPEAIRAIDTIHFEAWHLDALENVLVDKLDHTPRRAKLMRINWEEMGRVAAKRVLARLAGGKATGEVIRLAPRLVELCGKDVTPLHVNGSV